MTTKPDVDVVTQIVVDFHAFFTESHQQTEEADENLKMVAGFILMTSNFRDFVDCYRCEDSIGASDGYQKFAPVWKINGQNKYLQCWVEQLHQINEKHKYSLG